LTGSLSTGATTLSLSAVSSALTVPKGQRIWLTGNKSVVIAKTIALSATAANSVPIEAAQVSESTGAAAVVKVICSGLHITGTFSKWAQAVVLSDVYGADITADFILNGKYDILLSGSRADSIRIRKSRFISCGQKNDGSLLSNIHLGTNGDNIRITDCEFEPHGSPLVNRNVFGGTELSNVAVESSYFGGSSLAAIAIGPQSSNASQNGKICIHGNTYRNVTSLVPPGTIQGFYVGSVYQGYASTAPATGYWNAGDVLVNPNPVIGEPKGWRCTTAGIPGTWVVDGVL
jgi:pectate lyase